MSSTPKRLSTAEDERNVLREKIAEAVKDYDLSSDAGWQALDELSTHTVLEGVEIEPEGVLIDKEGNFKGVMNVYVTLQYGKDEEEGYTTSDAFLGRFEGHLEKGDPKIDSVTVDTSPFFD